MILRRVSYLVVALATGLLVPSCGSNNDAPPVPSGPPTLSVERVFPGLTFSMPVAMLQAPGDGSRWFVVEQAGRVLVFNNVPSPAAPTEFINITDRVDNGGEMGLLGMAFHPDFPDPKPLVYLSYTNSDSGLESRVSEFQLGPGGKLDPTTERILMRIAQPEANHNGGHIAFGPDGFLYVGLGDGGGGNDGFGDPTEPHGPIGNGQNMMTLLGKMLRIDVSPAVGYEIPSDPGGNPFAGNAKCGANGTGAANCPEIYASGFRNPWRWSFDRLTGALWVGDVGQSSREEIDRVALGGNYGWRCFEGTEGPNLPPCGNESSLLPPVAEYGRTVGRSVTGGYVYRGAGIPGLQGRYVFGDFVTGRIWHIANDTAPTVVMNEGFDSGFNISSFGEDNDGELYVVRYSGQLYRLIGF